MTTTDDEEAKAINALSLTEAELRLLWMGTRTIREANPDDEVAASLDEKVSALVAALPPLSEQRS